MIFYESIQIAKLENDFLNWGIPKLDSKTIYFQNTFNFKENLCVKIVERKIPVYEKIDSIQLFPRNDIEKNIKRNFLFFIQALYN